jgi:AAA domain
MSMDDLPPFVPPPGSKIVDPDSIVVVPFRARSQGNGQDSGEPFVKRYELQYEGDPDTTPEFKFLVKGMLPERGLAFLGGQHSMGKTYIALELAQAVITAGEFAGRLIERPGGVLMFAAEGLDVIRQRWNAIKKAKIEPMLQQQGLWLTPMPFWWSLAMPKLTDADVRAQLGACMKEVQQLLKAKGHDCPLSLIIIDTLMSASLFKDAKDSAQMQQVMDILRWMSTESGALVVVVDHLGKDADRGLRDSSVKEQAADAILSILGERSTSGALSNTRLAMAKLRGGRAGYEVPFELIEVKLGVDRDGDPITELTVKWDVASHSNKAPPSKASKPMLDAMHEALLAHGEMTVPRPGMVMLRAVNAEHVRATFDQSYPVQSDGDEKLRKDAIRKAWKRAIDACKGLVGSYRYSPERELMWLIKDEPKP